MLTGLLTSFFATSLGKKLPPWLWEIIIIGLAALLLALGHHVLVVRHDNGVRAEQRQKDQKALDQTVANYRAAAAKAAADDAAKDAATKAQQAKINQETADEYATRLAAARADIQRLRSARPANPGSPAGPGVPVVPTPTCGTDKATDDPTTRAFDCAIQLDELITEVERQHAVDPNAEVPRK